MIHRNSKSFRHEDLRDITIRNANFLTGKSRMIVMKEDYKYQLKPGVYVSTAAGSRFQPSHFPLVRTLNTHRRIPNRI